MWPCWKRPLPRGQRLDDALLDQDAADRLIAASEALGDGDEVGHDALLLDGVERAGAAHAAHHLVGDEEDAVPVADLAHALEVAGHRRHGTLGRAADSLGAEGDHAARADAMHRLFELAAEPIAVGLGRLVALAVAVFVARRDVRHVDQERRELAPPPFVAADGKGAERVAVVALPPGDEVAPPGLADLDEVLPRQLERGLDRFRAARDEIDVRGAARRTGEQVIGERFGDFGREEARVRVGDPVDLRVHGADHVGMAVAEARHGGAAGRVEVFAPLGIDDGDAVAGHGDRRRGLQLAVQDAAHGAAPAPLRPPRDRARTRPRSGQ